MNNQIPQRKLCLIVFTLCLASGSNLGRAKAVMAQPLNLSQNSNRINNYETKDFLHEGKELYDKGQLNAAAKMWHRAKKKSLQTQQLANLIHSNNYLATVYQDLGNWQTAEQFIKENLALIKQQKNQIRRRNSQPTNYALLSAQTLNTQGSWQLKKGNSTTALALWQETEALYRSFDDSTGIIISQINQAQALQSMGYFRRSQEILKQAQQQLTTIPDSQLKIATLQSLGVVLELSGDIPEAEKLLNQSLDLARQLGSLEDIAATLFRLGNVARTKQDYSLAREYYQKAIASSQQPHLKLQARLNQFSLLVETDREKSARQLIEPIKSQLNRFSPSRSHIYDTVNFARSLIALKEDGVKEILDRSLQQAINLEDKIAQAHVLGTLGNWQETQKNYDLALQQTNQALKLLVGREKTTLTATLYWQAGRILKAQEKTDLAIAAYETAVDNLQHLQRDLVSVNPEIQFSFRQQVEPIHRQLVSLLLQDIDRLSPEQKQNHLERSRLAIENLKQQELENFFRIACLDVTEQNIEQVDTQAAVIYPILLDNSIEVIISLPGKPLVHHRTAIDSAIQSATFQELLQYLNPVFASQAILPPAQKLYDWLIRPAAETLKEQEIETLVFVLDGKLRNLPMAVLHDGERYLIEQYDLALTPGLQLLRNTTRKDSSEYILTGGITEPRQGFNALPAVRDEIEQINHTFSSQTLLDGEFTNSNLQAQISKQPISILHLATHGQFSSRAEDTFILTWDERINVNKFDRLLNQRESGQAIDLLVLSACQTAAGDDRAILGLAGMAVRSGAKTTLASLWSVSDRSTASLMSEFYNYLKQPDYNKADALRQAQLSLLQNPEYQHPYYWSPFILVGNWQ